MNEFRKFRDSRYSASNNGEIRNDLTGRILKQGKDKYGYLKLHLSIHGKRTYFKSHRVILGAWNPNENEPYLHANHKNFDRSDNRIENLEWLSPFKNNEHKDARLYAVKRECRKIFDHLVKKHGDTAVLKKLCEMDI